MSKQINTGDKDNNGNKTKSKGETKQSPQKGAPGVSKKSAKHQKDESGGAAKNTTKKQQNSI